MLTKLMSDLASGGISRKDTLAACLERINSDPAAAAIFSSVDAAGIQAAIDRPADGGAPRPLSGIAIAVADSLLAKGLPDEASSALLAGFVSPYDSAAVELLKAADATLSGKTRIPELAVTPVAGEPEPVAVDRSAEAVVKGMCHAAVGVDCDGEFRRLAAAGGLCGIKASYGAVSRHGVVSIAPSMETVSVSARSVGDLIPVLQAVGGNDPRDITTVVEPLPDLASGSWKSVSGLRVGWIGDVDKGEAGDPIDALVKQGATAAPLSLPSFKHWGAVHSILYHAEASSQLGRYDGIRFGRYPTEAKNWDSIYYKARAAFGLSAKRAAMLGAFALSTEGIDVYHQQALRLRRRINEEFAKVWEMVDVLVVPASLESGRTAVRVGANLSGCPALALAGAGVEIWAEPFKAYNALRAGLGIRGETRD